MVVNEAPGPRKMIAGLPLYRRVNPVSRLVPEPTPPTLVRRNRLIRLIEQPHHAAVTVVVAGAGYGKTALVADWASLAAMPVGWLRLESADNDPARLARRIAGAVDEALQDDADGDRPDVADGCGDDSPGAALCRWLALAPPPLCLVLDDCHCLTNPVAIELVDQVVAAMPAGLHLIVIGRARLPLRLGRLRVTDQVRGIDAADLRYTTEEVAEDFRARGLTEIPVDEIQTIRDAADGWATGIHLTGIAIAASRDQAEGESTRRELLNAYLDEYVEQELLAPLPEDIRAFVEATSFLPYLTPELCNVSAARLDSRAMLARTGQALPFLSSDRQNPARLVWQPMIAGSLWRRAPGNAESIARAARWLLQSGDLDAAGAIAVCSDDVALLVEVGEAIGHEYAMRSDFRALVRWLDRLPPEIVANHPSLGYWRIVSDTIKGHIWTPAALRLGEVEAIWLASGAPLVASRAALCAGLRAFYLGDDAGATARLREAGDMLPDGALVERMYAATFLGRIAFRRGDDARATECQNDAIRCAAGLPLDEGWSWQAIAAERGNAYALRGDIFSAITKYRMMLAELPAALQRYEGFLRVRLISLLIERGELDEAGQELEHVERLMAESAEPVEWRHGAALARVRFLIAIGRHVEAEEWGAVYVKLVRRLPEKSQLLLDLAYLWLERGDRAMVRSWLDDVDDYEYPAVQVFGDINYRALALSLLLAEGNFGEAAELATELVDEAIAKKRWAEFVGLSMRRAVALHQIGDEEEARQAARAAIERGVAGGFVRSFAVPLFDVTALFSDVWNETGLALRVKRRLQALADRNGETGAGGLTRREIELLRLVALGRSNQQIAADLFISVNTVRNHLVKISRRLHARSRVEAVTRARELGLID